LAGEALPLGRAYHSRRPASARHIVEFALGRFASASGPQTDSRRADGQRAAMKRL
jgi:hypothetical protein